ncbi:hypothetical protein [Actinocatenispora rupis]|uniref:Uncharacterized protein n=1 Tax=Actinocatenispora rupis TaxID=519421 RepID=A0A8J3NE87_9ACTN|nr:hypothetical protein [Actinocatenispora rupis]GID16129.1 hypothetical protein Aru02nite_70180 [Actinocatenispora rupis]
MSSQAEERPTRTTDYTPSEWRLLVELPELVVIAATSAEADGMRRTVDEGMAGDRGIESGTHSDSPLVRKVAAELWTDDDTGTPQPTAVEFNDRAKGLADTLAKARRAATVLAAKAAPADARAYTEWVSRIAEVVCGAAKSGGFLGIGGESVSPAERRFLTSLSDALAGR